MDKKEVILPSGAKLSLQPAPFADSKALYQCVLREFKTIPFNTSREMGEVMKDLICAGFSSPDVEAALSKCMVRCLYNGMKIDSDTFENSSAREDYVVVATEVLTLNVSPFLKNLSAVFASVSAMIQRPQA